MKGTFYGIGVGPGDPELLTVWRFAFGEALAVPELTPDTSTTATLAPWRRPSV